MAVTSGFFDSVDHDRLYNAEDVGRIMEGIFTDGILNDSRDDKFVVNATTGLDLTVGSGKGWFKNTWIRNDDNITLTANPNTLGVARIDTVVIDVNKEDDVRANTILIVEGSSSRPSLIDTASHKQYPLADITIAATGSTITGVTDRRNEIYSTSPLVIKPYYPVGAIYMSVNNIEPDILFGGVWEQISGRFLIGCGGTSGLANGDTGGSWFHTLTVNEMPAHTHSKGSLYNQGATANIILANVGSVAPTQDFVSITVPSWPYLNRAGIPDLALDNYAPASWNYPYGYQGVQSLDQEPNVGPSPYTLSQTALRQVDHTHTIYGDTGSSGNGNAMEIRPPYLAVYMWKRVS